MLMASAQIHNKQANPRQGCVQENFGTQMIDTIIFFIRDTCTMWLNVCGHIFNSRLKPPFLMRRFFIRSWSMDVGICPFSHRGISGRLVRDWCQSGLNTDHSSFGKPCLYGSHAPCCSGAFPLVPVKANCSATACKTILSQTICGNIG